MIFSPRPGAAHFVFPVKNSSLASRQILAQRVVFCSGAKCCCCCCCRVIDVSEGFWKWLVMVVFSTAISPPVVHCYIFKHNSVTVVNLRHDHCVSAPISCTGFRGLREMKCVVWSIYEAQTVTLRGSGHLLVWGCGWYVSITNCFLIRCESVSCILILFRDHYRAGGNLSVLMDDSGVSRNFNIKTKGLMGRWEEHQKWWICLLQSHYLTSPFSVWGRAASQVNHKLTGAMWRFDISWQHGD